PSLTRPEDGGADPAGVLSHAIERIAELGRAGNGPAVIALLAGGDRGPDPTLAAIVETFCAVEGGPTLLLASRTRLATRLAGVLASGHLTHLDERQLAYSPREIGLLPRSTPGGPPP